MARKGIGAAIIAVVVWMSMVAGVSAGGWATVEMEKPVTQVEANEPVTMEFRLLQHGVTPTDWTTTYFEATNAETGETFRVDATPGAETGDWSVVVTFPSAGSWDWAIRTEELEIEDTFPAMSVIGEAASAGSAGGVTQAQLDAAITGATDPLEKQIASMTGEMETLQKQVSSLSGERDTLQKQIVSLTGERDTFEKRIAAIEAGEASASADSGISWWVAASVGALASAIVAIAAYLLASRRGLVISPPKRARA